MSEHIVLPAVSPRRRAKHTVRRTHTPNLQRRTGRGRSRTRLKPSHKSRLNRRAAKSKGKVSRNNAKAIEGPVFRVSNQDNTKSKNSALKFPVVPDSHASALPPSRTSTIRPLNDELTQIPNPTPAAGLSLPNTVGVGSPLIGSVHTDTGSGAHAASTTPFTPVAKAVAKTTSFSPLPPLLSLLPTSTILSAEFTREALPTSTALPTPGSTSNPDSSKSHQVTAAIVVLLSVGSALFLLGVCIVVKMCARRRRQPRPTPSLPVLKDIEADNDFFETKESPMFGGEARLSSTAGNNGPIWAWVQYPQTKSAAETPVQDYNADVYPGDPHYATQRYHFATQTPTSAPQATEYPPGLQTLHNVPPATAGPNKRSSGVQTMPTSNSTMHEPTSSSDRSGSASTPEYHAPPKRPKSKSANRRSRLPPGEETRYRDSSASFVGLAYDTDVVSPGPTDYIQPMETPVIENPFEGRARVRSGYYAAGAYPRISTLPSASYSIATATRVNVAQRNSFGKDKYSTVHQSNSKRLRDTQALTYALGLASPKTDYGAPSPQPTLYPDDSMSVADIKHGKKRNLEAIPDVPVIKPIHQATTGADTLMSMNFGVSHMSLTGIAPEGTSDAREAEADRHTSSKPPRVPSPPPLPSLAQMALAQHNADAYASYRSPTYSLYGLYEGADRKSVAR